MLKKILFKLSRSFIKLLLPSFSLLFIKLKVNKRIANYLNEKSSEANNYYNFSNIIKKKLSDKKILALDIGAQGGFNSDIFFPEKYNKFFEGLQETRRPWRISRIKRYDDYKPSLFNILNDVKNEIDEHSLNNSEILRNENYFKKVTMPIIIEKFNTSYESKITLNDAEYFNNLIVNEYLNEYLQKNLN